MAAPDLVAVAEDSLDSLESVEYMGFHIMRVGDDIYNVQYDGHAGSVGTIHPSEFNSALEIVDELNRYVILLQEHTTHGDFEDLVDWAGPAFTSYKDKAEENPDQYVYVPDEVEEEEWTRLDEI